ncbi:glycerol-3-phosphate dehydrogenase/oxidase [Nocardioides daeguensis]|uniref:Glycerol-3-phosphate dehydrogenase/oxidase n=1 Tax=Nocardioides daeguensis TaxID=908359 RepID=A0ABP6WHK3_9ACTN|nr:glycerol-3-phosphate dehydrogenase/oxidase [Nocardioides daeguensis]MBV6727938.1 glycerol-3-phosphate dehydrogenase/oxidase [Nocardioides daeguensis]MCR1771681.1 glycerol-3-phosphate dehydrogenase/oxidase [Nocardioides daeguensis]
MTASPTRITPGLAAVPTEVDVLVVGLGVTGAGVALDAVSRGLTVLAVDAHDLAFGTSRFSSKLVHGGLRYLASGQVGIAHESAVERGILMETTAPHLTRPLPSIIPLAAGVSRPMGALAGAGFLGGDLLRRAAGTSGDTLPRPRRLSAAETRRIAPPLRTDGLRGAYLGWDGQLEDDARLVTTIARTAAERGAHVRTHARVVAATGRAVDLRDELTGETVSVTTRSVINAAGVWAGDLVDDVRLRPSRGTHLVLRAGTLPGLDVAVFAPIPGETNRFVLVLPQPDGQFYVGLTDEPVEGPVPDVAEPTEVEIGFLLDVVSASFARPLRRTDVVGAFAGLRPLLDGGDDATADLSRKHAVLISPTGVVTIVGGKLTTYRRMAEDAVDAAVAHARLTAGPCITASLPLAGAAPREALADRAAKAGHRGAGRLVRRYGADADLVLTAAVEASGWTQQELLAPVADTLSTLWAELFFGVTHEGAADVADLLDRRTRIGLVPADRALAVPAAEKVLEILHADR